MSLSVGSSVLAWHQALCGQGCHSWVWKLEQSRVKPSFHHSSCMVILTHLLSGDPYPLTLRPGCLLFYFICLFSRWNLQCELQNRNQLWLWSPLWVPFPPPVSQSAEEKRNLSGPCRKWEKLVLAESVHDSFSAEKLESLVPAGVICYHNMPEMFPCILRGFLLLGCVKWKTWRYLLQWHRNCAGLHFLTFTVYAMDYAFVLYE